MMGKTKLFIYRAYNVMEGHIFTDDVALCYASSLEEARKVFYKMYGELLMAGEVIEARFNYCGICVCTDY